jgi:hypothetical protein
MTAFDTPDPITVKLELGVADVRLVTGDLGRTVVDVTPTDSTSKGDLGAARLTQVEYASGTLTVKSPKHWRRWTPRGGRESVSVEIQLPEDSRVDADLGVAAVTGSGRLGQLDVKMGMGDIHLEECGPTRIRTGLGDVTLERVSGDANLKTGSGRIDIGFIEGSATVKNSNGDTRIGVVTDRAQLQSASGTIRVDKAEASVTAKTAFGDIGLGALSQGSTEARTACGQIDIGVLEGVAAWLDLSTGFGRVNRDLVDSTPPSSDERSVEVRAHTAVGDINVIRTDALAGAGATS